MDGGDESHVNPLEAARRRDAVGQKIMDHWKGFGVALKSGNTQGMADLNKGMSKLTTEYRVHDAYTRPGQGGGGRGGSGFGGGGGGGIDLTKKKVR